MRSADAKGRRFDRPALVRVLSTDWIGAAAAATLSLATFSDMQIKTGSSRALDNPEVGSDRGAARLA